MTARAPFIDDACPEWIRISNHLCDPSDDGENLDELRDREAPPANYHIQRRATGFRLTAYFGRKKNLYMGSFKTKEEAQAMREQLLSGKVYWKDTLAKQKANRGGARDMSGRKNAGNIVRH